MHYCTSLREVLSRFVDAEALASSRAVVVERCREMRRTLPVTYKSGTPFMSSGALFTAFAFELERARSAEHLAEIQNVVTACAEGGLVPYHSARESYGRVRDALRNHGDDDARRALEYFSGKRVEAPVDFATAEDVTPWTLTRNTPSLDAKIVAAAMEVQRTGFAVVDGVLGEQTSDTVRRALDEFADQSPAFIKGELDRTERHVIGDEAVDKMRDDWICWLSGDEDDPMVGAFCQFLRVTLLNPLHLALGTPLAPVDSYVSNAMLSVYEPGARGFVSHVDNCGPELGDARALSAVYYPSSSGEDEGGALKLFPDHPTRCVTVTPTADRLVLFASARVPHCVTSRSSDAKRRVAASFWYVGDPNAIGPQ